MQRAETLRFLFPHCAYTGAKLRRAVRAFRIAVAMHTLCAAGRVVCENGRYYLGSPAFD